MLGSITAKVLTGADTLCSLIVNIVNISEKIIHICISTGLINSDSFGATKKQLLSVETLTKKQSKHCT